MYRASFSIIIIIIIIIIVFVVLVVITNKCIINITTVYITTVYNLYSYMFRRFHLIIREYYILRSYNRAS